MSCSPPTHQTNRTLLRLAGQDPERRAKVRLLREFDPASVSTGELDVPDPYYGATDGFDRVLDIVDRGLPPPAC